MLNLYLTGKLSSTHSWLVSTAESSGIHIGAELSLSSKRIMPRPNRAEKKNVHNTTVHGLLAIANPNLSRNKDKTKICQPIVRHICTVNLVRRVLQA